MQWDMPASLRTQQQINIKTNKELNKSQIYIESEKKREARKEI